MYLHYALALVYAYQSFPGHGHLQREVLWHVWEQDKCIGCPVIHVCHVQQHKLPDIAILTKPLAVATLQQVEGHCITSNVSSLLHSLECYGSPRRSASINAIGDDRHALNHYRGLPVATVTHV